MHLLGKEEDGMYKSACKSSEVNGTNYCGKGKMH